MSLENFHRGGLIKVTLFYINRLKKTDRFLKTFIARIQIYPHNHSSYIPIIQKPLAINKYLLVIMYFYTKF